MEELKGYITELGAKDKFFHRNIYHEINEKFSTTFESFLSKYNYTDVYQCAYYYDSNNIEAASLIASPYFDFDGDINTEYRKIANEVMMVAKFFEINWKIPVNRLKIYFSGSKGFHLIIPRSIVNVHPDQKLNEKFKLLAEYVKRQLNCKYLDLQIYDRKRLFRIPNTINSKSNLFKVQLTYQQLRELTTKTLLEYASNIHEEIISDETAINEAMIQYKKFMSKLIINKHNESKRQRFVSTKRRVLENTSYQSKTLLPCIKNLLINGVRQGRRNNTSVALASSLLQNGKKLKEIASIMEEWNSFNQPPLSERELYQTINSAYAIFCKDMCYGCAAFKNLDLCVGKDCSLAEREE